MATSKEKECMDEIMKEIMSDMHNGLTLRNSAQLPIIPVNQVQWSDISPKEILHNIRANRERRAKYAKLQEEREKEALAKLLGEENLFRFAYVPFVISGLAWDYADTLLDMSAWMKLSETRHLGRRIRELRKEYDQIHSTYIDKSHQNSEIENMYVYEEGVKNIFKTYFVNLRCDLKSEYPELSEDYVTFLVAVYQCHVTLQSLLLYAKRQSERVAELVGHPIGNIIARPVRELAKLVLEYVGDKPAPERFNKLQETYISTFATQMALIELTKIKE